MRQKNIKFDLNNKIINDYCLNNKIINDYYLNNNNNTDDNKKKYNLNIFNKKKYNNKDLSIYGKILFIRYHCSNITHNFDCVKKQFDCYKNTYK